MAWLGPLLVWTQTALRTALGWVLWKPLCPTIEHRLRALHLHKPRIDLIRFKLIYISLSKARSLADNTFIQTSCRRQNTLLSITYHILQVRYLHLDHNRFNDMRYNARLSMSSPHQLCFPYSKCTITCLMDRSALSSRVSKVSRIAHQHAEMTLTDYLKGQPRLQDDGSGLVGRVFPASASSTGQISPHLGGFPGYSGSALRMCSPT